MNAAAAATPDWLVARILAGHQHEQRLASSFKRNDLEFYLPKIASRTWHRGRHVQRIDALFPGYVFVPEVEHARGQLDRTPGVIDILGSISHAVIGALRSRESTSGCVVLHAPLRFAVGTRTRINSGHFIGLTGIYAGLSRTGREHVLLQMLGRSTDCELEPDVELEAA